MGRRCLQVSQCLEEFMAQTFRQKQDVTLCYLDLEGVDDINNTYGDKVGWPLSWWRLLQ